MAEVLINSEVTSGPAWWNLDIYLAEVISFQLREFIRNAGGHPSGMTEEEWKSQLSSIAERLEKYSKKFDTASFAEEMAITVEGQQAMKELAEIFPALWS